MQKKLTHIVFKTVSRVADEMDIEASVIGGYVRDQLLGHQSPDIDIVVTGNGIDVAKEVAKRLTPSPKVNFFKNFGTAQFVFDEGNKKSEWEFVGARKESYQRHTRNPIVEEGTLRDDQDRRDFTINTLALSLKKENYGELIDPFGGIKDLKKGIIRTPLDPSITFSDDPLRMLRAIRFATRLGFTIEKKTWEGLCANVHRIDIITPERIHTEINKILLCDRPSVGFLLLDESGLLQLIFPELTKLKGVDIRNKVAHKDNFIHTLKVLDNIAPHTTNLWLRWAALLHDVGKPASKKFDPSIGWTFYGHAAIGMRMVPNIFKRLRLPTNEKMKYVQKLVELHLRPIALAEDGVTDSAIRRLLFDAGEAIDDLMLLAEADITSKDMRKVKRYLQNFYLVRQKLIDVEGRDKLRNWQPPVSGEVIMETFGIAPSKMVGDLKSKIREAILDCEIENNYEEAFSYLLLEAAKVGLTPKNNNI